VRFVSQQKDRKRERGMKSLRMNAIGGAGSHLNACLTKTTCFSQHTRPRVLPGGSPLVSSVAAAQIAQFDTWGRYG
jgi:hypothetical protein